MFFVLVFKWGIPDTTGSFGAHHTPFCCFYFPCRCPLFNLKFIIKENMFRREKMLREKTFILILDLTLACN